MSPLEESVPAVLRRVLAVDQISCSLRRAIDAFRAGGLRSTRDPIDSLLACLAGLVATQQATKTQVADPVVGGIPAPTRGATEPREADPAPAANHAERGVTGSRRIDNRSRRISAIEVGRPFPNVAVHIVESPRIRTVALHWSRPSKAPSRLKSSIGVITVAVRLVAVQGAPKRKRRRRAGSTRIFPLRLCRQRRFQPLRETLRQFIAEFHRVIP